jgi:hypothetical protein
MNTGKRGHPENRATPCVPCEKLCALCGKKITAGYAKKYTRSAQRIQVKAGNQENQQLLASFAKNFAPFAVKKHEVRKENRQ